MPVSDKKFDEVLYDLLPNMYHQADKEAQPIEYPLKRFLQVASVGLEKVESEIDGLQLLFNADSMPSKFIDPVGRMLGFEFPEGTMEDEKRRLIKNLPTLYKLKGNELVFGMLARLLFHKDAKATTEWVYTENTTNIRINLEVGDSDVVDLEGKRKRFLELIEFFRPVNVGTSWLMLVVYSYLVDLAKSEDDFDITTILMDDNLINLVKETSFLNSKHTLGESFLLYGGIILPETYYLSKVTEQTIDTVHYPTIDYEVSLTIEETPLDRLKYPTEIDNLEIYPLDVDGSDVIVDCRHMLNYGLIGSTLVLNNLPEITQIGG